MDILGKRLADARKMRGMSQVELAVALGDQYTQASISHMESGRAMPPSSRLIEIAQALNISTDYLLGLTDEPTAVGMSKWQRVQESFADYILESPHGALGISYRIRGSDPVWFCYHEGKQIADLPDMEAAMDFCERIEKRLALTSP